MTEQILLYPLSTEPMAGVVGGIYWDANTENVNPRHTNLTM